MMKKIMRIKNHIQIVQKETKSKKKNTKNEKKR